MHEMAIAVEIVRQLDLIAAENSLARIDEVAISAGAARGIVPEALQMAFRAAASGTCAEEASLTLALVPAVAECRRCRHRFEPQPDSFLCGECGQADVEMVSGHDVVLASVAGREVEATASEVQETEV